MTSIDPGTRLAELKKLGDKIATELVFAESGKDLGLLPVNSLLGRIEDLAGGEAAIEPLPRRDNPGAPMDERHIPIHRHIRIAHAQASWRMGGMVAGLDFRL